MKKTKNEGYYTVSYKNCRTRFPTKHEAEEALKRYQNGECPVCGMNKPKMCPPQANPPRDSDSDATFGSHSSDSESEAESVAATQTPAVAQLTPPLKLRVHANPNGTLQVTINGVTFTCEGDFVYP